MPHPDTPQANNGRVDSATEPHQDTRPVVILGLGGGGTAIAARIGQLGVRPPLVLAAADTDRESLEAWPSLDTLPLSGEWTGQRGTGGDMLLGERAASASGAELKELIQPARLLILVAALGGGTGAGAAKVVGRLAQQQGVLTILVATLPFSFEGNARLREAEAALAPLRQLVDAAIAVPNDMLFNTLAADTPVPEAFCVTDGILASVALGLARLPCSKAILPADFTRLRTLLKRDAICSLAVGRGTGDDRWRQAVEQFLACPLLARDTGIARADFALLTVTGDASMSIGEVRGCLNALQERLPDDAQLVTSAYVRSDASDLELTGVIGRYHDKQDRKPAPPEGESHQAFATPATDPAGAPRASRGKRSGHRVQAELPLQEPSLGIFAHCDATTVRGENLDIPTFQRQGIHLDLGATPSAASGQKESTGY